MVGSFGLGRCQARVRSRRPRIFSRGHDERPLPHRRPAGLGTRRARQGLHGGVAGGWALDLFLGRRTRPHADLELSVLAADQASLFGHLRGWDLRLAAPGASLPRWDGGAITPPFHQVWARHGAGTPAGADEFAADPTMLGFLLEQGGRGRWAFRRHPAVTRPLDLLGARSPQGVPFVRPEIALLYKAKAPRFKDERDFDRALPHLDATARRWLASSLELAHPGHPWRARL